jgi:hypothetical protein
LVHVDRLGIRGRVQPVPHQPHPTAALNVKDDRFLLAVEDPFDHLGLHLAGPGLPGTFIDGFLLVLFHRNDVPSARQQLVIGFRRSIVF